MGMTSLATNLEAALVLDRLNRQCGGKGKDSWRCAEGVCTPDEIEEAIVRLGNGHADALRREVAERYQGRSVPMGEAFDLLYRRAVAYQREKER